MTINTPAIPKEPSIFITHAEVVAARKAGNIPGWEPYRWERVGSDSVLITGGVPRLITRGPRKGELTWAGCVSQSEVVTNAERAAEYARYEQDTGGCGECMSTGRRPGSPRDVNHPKYTVCPRCQGSTKAPGHQQGAPT